MRAVNSRSAGGDKGAGHTEVCCRTTWRSRGRNASRNGALDEKEGREVRLTFASAIKSLFDLFFFAPAELPLSCWPLFRLEGSVGAFILSVAATTLSTIDWTDKATDVMVTSTSPAAV